MFYKKQENCREHLCSPPFFGGVRVAHFLVFCVVFYCFISLHSVSCLPNVASVSEMSILDSPFNFFSNIYLQMVNIEILIRLVKDYQYLDH